MHFYNLGDVLINQHMYIHDAVSQVSWDWLFYVFDVYTNVNSLLMLNLIVEALMLTRIHL